jgi:hypothetical protein
MNAKEARCALMTLRAQDVAAAGSYGFGELCDPACE